MLATWQVRRQLHTKVTCKLTESEVGILTREMLEPSDAGTACDARVRIRPGWSNLLPEAVTWFHTAVGMSSGIVPSIPSDLL